MTLTRAGGCGVLLCLLVIPAWSQPVPPPNRGRTRITAAMRWKAENLK